MRKSKDQLQKRHAARRFAERFGVRLTQYLWDNILNQIHRRKARFFKKQSLRISIFDVDVILRPQEILGDKEPGPLTVRIVYDRDRNNIVSALTLDMDCEIE